MNSKIKILIVEHDESDIDLIQYELRKGGIDCLLKVVQNEQDYADALQDFIPDIILSDYSLPSFNGPTAFDMREQVAPGTPFIFVSGSIGEENSIEYIKNGVTDYVLKDKLFTLVTKVKRALNESKEKQHKNKTELELAQSAKRLARAQQLAKMGSWEIDMIDGVQSWSAGIYEVYGIDKKQRPSTELFLSVVHPDDLALLRSHGEKAYATLDDASFNFRFIRMDNGEARYAYTEYRFDFDRDKKPVRLQGIVIDISEQKKAEENLMLIENRFRAIIEKSTDMKTLSTSEGEIIYGSPSITKVLGYPLEKYLYKPIFSFIHPDDTLDFLKQRDELLKTSGKSIYKEMRFLHESGSWIWCEGIITNMLHEPGVNAMVSNFRDISEKKLAEQLREFDSINLNALINNTTDLMWSMDLDFKLITFNQPFYETIKHMSGKELTKGDDIFSVILSPEQSDRFKISYARAFAGEAFTEVEHIKGPVEFWSEISYYPIRKENKVIGTACHSHDITQRKLAELERIKITTDLIRHNKDLEQFAYIISHNLRAPVANIIGITATVQSNRLSQEKEKEMMGHLHTSVKKLDEVIKDLNHVLQVNKNFTEKKEIVKFSELMINIQLSINILIQKEDVRFIINFTEVDEMLTLKSYLYSIFFNLITNSIKYRAPHIRPVIEITSKKTEKKIELIFKDYGLGIELGKKKNEVFGLYKRFHQHTEGKGIGLYMVKAQVETLGGTISIESEVNKGTEFRIQFDNQ